MPEAMVTARKNAANPDDDARCLPILSRPPLRAAPCDSARRGSGTMRHEAASIKAPLEECVR